MSVDYKSTIFLPQTDFPMKAGLPQREPELLARWAKMDLYGRLRRQGEGREKFGLHDGPPYANGHLHIGHALNKILKDVITRCQQMLGKDADYVPGWDCHGLPIEWKIEEKYRAAGKDKDEVPIIQFRQECRDFAQTWIDIQREEFKRLGVIGDWDRPYTTMAYPAEARIVRELAKFAMNGGLYKGAKPVMWSIIERTALAEAEVEYQDHVSTTIFVRFPVTTAPLPALEGASVVIWTTTPWTIPGNRAIAYGPDMDYVVVSAERGGEESLARPNERVVVAEGLLADFLKATGITRHEIHARLKGSELACATCAHPFHGQGYDFPVPLLAGDFVTTDTGTGFVHCAPGHGADDWELCIAHGIAVPETVGPDGLFYPHVPLFAGRQVLEAGKNGKYFFPANKVVVEALRSSGALLASGKIEHSYPHSWRSKAPLIFRNTPQWFISMSANGLRDKALAAIDATRWVPAGGRNRIHAMVESRPDWCVSRQRAWGVPIAVFVHKKTGELLRDQKVFDRIAEVIAAEGCDVWFAADPARFLAPDHDPADYDQVRDILDVWFDSGCTHAFVLEDGPWKLQWPASLYLEGSDQHRGWFHSSLLESCGTRGRAPYDAVLTHGFVMAEDGRKMSKSLGNVVAPQQVVEASGADILRLWVVGSDYSEDLRIGPEILKRQVDVYRRLRNTLRYVLGNLDGFVEAERLPVAEMPELERWVLHRLFQLDRQLRETCDNYEFHRFFNELHNFCAIDLSAFYFDIRKDSLYCDRPDSTRRRAARTVLAELHSCLTAWLAPFLCFTAEEAWLCRVPDADGSNPDSSVHLRLFPDIPAAWQDDALAAKWEKLRDVRRVVTGALELERAAKRIGSSLQARPEVYLAQEYRDVLDGIDLAEIAITSGIDLRPEAAPDMEGFRLPDINGVTVVPQPAGGHKCQRCWKVLDEVGTIAGHETLCGRCADSVAGTA